LGNIAAQFEDKPEQLAANALPNGSQGIAVQDAASGAVAKEVTANAAVLSPATDTAAVAATLESTITEPAPEVAEITPKAPVIKEPVVKEPEAIVVAPVADPSAVDVKVADTKVVDDDFEVAVAEPMAPAQAAGDLIAMAEKAKSSSRNEQVNLAKTILASSKKPAEDSSAITKEAEVDSVMVAAAGGLDNDMLIVIKDKVNLRDGPSIDHPVVLQLEQGQELMEFKREGRWVHVGAYGTSGKIGWVHQRLVGPVAK